MEDLRHWLFVVVGELENDAFSLDGMQRQVHEHKTFAQHKKSTKRIHQMSMNRDKAKINKCYGTELYLHLAGVSEN